ncbi:hypothetical protein U1Q18_044539 [Sarracenia purpurea var. burkii]
MCGNQGNFKRRKITEAWNQSKRLSTSAENSSGKEEELQRSCSVKPTFGFCSEIHVEIKGFGVSPRFRVSTRLVTGVFPVSLLVGRPYDFICTGFFGRSGFVGLSKENT